MFQVTVRLQDGDEADAGIYDDRGAAEKHAATLIADADAGRWLTLGDRFVRPAAIVSIDIHEGRAPRWQGSQARSGWSQQEG